MTNLETYYGVNITIKKELEPYRITYLQDKAKKIAQLACFDITKFFVYIHHIKISQVKAKHFGSHIPIEKRIEKLHVMFEVNQKQRKKGTIMFFNDYADLEISKDVEFENGKEVIKRLYPGHMLVNDSIDTELITFIEKSIVKDKHRKIKVTIFPNPTDEYYEILNNAKKDKIYTLIDLPFEEKVKLNIYKLTRKKIIKHSRLFGKNVETIEDTIAASFTTNNIYNSTTNVDNSLNKTTNTKMEQNKYKAEGNVGAMGDNASATNFTQNSLKYDLPDNFDYSKLRTELQSLKLHLQENKDENNSEHLDAISSVIKAEKSASEKDKKGVLDYLKKTGNWALNAATQIGATLAAEVIKKSMGM